MKTELLLFVPDSPAACFLEGRVKYALPFGFLGRRIAGAYVGRRLEKLFAYRHRATAREIAAPNNSRSSPPRIFR
jgi:ligand-binding SRPBCC domain-containing protein